MRKIQFKKLAKNLKRRKILIGIAIGAALVAAIVTAAILMDASVVKLVNSDPEAGYLLGGGRSSSGSNITIRAQANPGYVFTNWTNTDGSVASEEPVHKISVPESDIVLTANWKIVDWELEFVLDSDENTTVYPTTVNVKSDSAGTSSR